MKAAILTLILTLAAGLVAAFIKRVASRRRFDFKTWLFSSDPADISLRSADNLRLLSEDQLDSYEDE